MVLAHIQNTSITRSGGKLVVEYPKAPADKPADAAKPAEAPRPADAPDAGAPPAASGGPQAAAESRPP